MWLAHGHAGRRAKPGDMPSFEQWAVTSNELVDWIKQIPALKQVMVLDTCVAGAVANKLIEKRDVTGDQSRPTSWRPPLVSSRREIFRVLRALPLTDISESGLIGVAVTGFTAHERVPGAKDGQFTFSR